ncbi:MULTISPECIES: dihydrodipicolinate synthase family protein [Vibrio]|uniref:dihydrodipicolinate synthase family protein n=1 Tax=Vibrio TaxID=662 RepID=UPI00111D5C83|nr:dihydrodipicolinate synthase family protein [Vibrio parahaemolyticus]EKM3679259.1 dihydrodipicolinate synthase family protein [Vibrio alginolyticus]ELA7327676.1 dihydrodipicolinate synthase family protein [Vibrio alginolyticus]TOB49047.1 dihydrodipicolinate synthase family protein [Vibrio parahaemolyticus]
MFVGLSAFPLTPMYDDSVDEKAFIGLIQRLVNAEVDSIGVLGSTGNYAYLTREERKRVAQIAVQHAENIPVMVGISALNLRDVLLNAENAQAAGASAVLLAPMSYQQLKENEVYKLYEVVTSNLSVPLCVYDNPGTTHFNFSDELHGRIAQLPNVRSIKIPGVPMEPQAALDRVNRLRALIPDHVSIGISGDACAATGLNAGCDVWYSVIGGLYPEVAQSFTTAAQKGDTQETLRLSNRLAPMWELFHRNGGSLRVVAAAAEIQNLVKPPCLPLPLRALEGNERKELALLLNSLELS